MKKVSRKRKNPRKRKSPGKRKGTKCVKKAKKKVTAMKKKPSKPKKSPVVSSSAPAGATLEEVGVITHYFPHVEAAVVKLKKGTLSIGDSIIIKGHTTDFQEQIDSMQLDHVPITNATRGQEIGLRVKEKVRDSDIVYKIVG